MKRKVHSARDNLDWTVHLVWTPEAIRPVGIDREDLIFLIFFVPALMFVVPLRYAGVMSWRVEAVAFPDGRRGMPLLTAWRVRGRRKELKRVVDEIAAALERGDTNPLFRGGAPSTSGRPGDSADPFAVVPIVPLLTSKSDRLSLRSPT